MSPAGQPVLAARRLLGLRTLLHFYRRRLRAHGLPELLAGIGIAAAVALLLAAGLSQRSVAASSKRVLRAVIGPADVQLRARGPDGFPETMLARVEALPGVERAAPLLERSMAIAGPNGSTHTVYVAGTDVSLARLNGLGRTLSLNALSAGAIGLSEASGRALGVRPNGAGAQGQVTLLAGGQRQPIRVSAVIGTEEAGALSGAVVGVMTLETMQRLLGAPGRVTRILVQSKPGAHAQVARELAALAGNRLIVSGPEEDIALLNEALRPAEQASALFAIIGALLGLLLAFNAILLTVPERRQAIADLRLSGTQRSAIVQLASFQGVCLGVAATAVGLACGYALSRWVFHQSTGYLTEAFALSGGTVVALPFVVLAAVGGVLVTWLATSVPLLDLRRGAPPDAIYTEHGVPGDAFGPRPQRWLAGVAVLLIAIASVLYATAPSTALIASVALAVATVLLVPVSFAAMISLARWLSDRTPRLSTLAMALGGVRGTTLRSLALAATGAVALFGSVALGGARANLLSGIRGFAHSYAADAPIWVSERGDNQATQQLAGDGGAARIARLPGVRSVSRFQGAFLTLGPRRVWVIARPPGGADNVLATQTLGGAGTAAGASARLAEGGWVAISRQVAEEHHVAVGGTLELPTPTGTRSFRVAAFTTNLAWSPGVVFMNSSDFARAWATSAPTALAVFARSSEVPTVESEIVRALGPGSGAEVASAATRESRIDALTSEGLSQLGVVSTLLIATAVVALAAALASTIHQRRAAMAGLRLSGAPSARLRRILLLEAGLMLGAGCITGAIAGVYGQFVIDAYLRHVTGFPVASAGASVRPIEIFAVVVGAALAAVAIPGWRASRVPPALALAEE